MADGRVVTPGFHARVYAIVRLVPEGRVVTYGDVAAALGSASVARHVGWALAALDPAVHGEVPWHRVINASGAISARGEVDRPSEQQRRLEAEGVVFSPGGKVNLKRFRQPFGVEEVVAALDALDEARR